MEASTGQSCKFILTTFDDGNNNHFYDSTFRLRPPFKPNGNGQYKVTINECLFKNNEPTLSAREDYFEFTIKYNDGTEHTDRFTMKKDLFTFSDKDDSKVIDVLTLKEGYIDSGSYINSIKLRDIDGLEYPSSGSNRYLGSQATMEVHLNDVNNVKSVAMRYSTNFGYLLNNLRSSDFIGTEGTDSGVRVFNFTFYNLRMGGPILYILKTPLQAIVPTYNAINQGYNIVAAVYNSTGYHNEVVQMCSSMNIVANELSNLRMELVNDQYEHVKLRCPLYIQITISNE